MAATTSREEFLAFMIAELSAMKESNRFDSQQVFSIEDILQKFAFDFPLLDEEQLSHLTAYIISLNSDCKGRDSFVVSNKQFITEKFLNNVRYLTSSQSYAASGALPALCGAMYVSLPLACLRMPAKVLNMIFPSPRVDKQVSSPKSVVHAVYANALRAVFSLIMSATPSLLLLKAPRHGGEVLDGNTAGDLAGLACALLGVVIDSAPPPSAGEGECLLGHLAGQFEAECSCCQPLIAGSDEGDRGVVSAAMDVLTHLMYLIRDLVGISPALYPSLMKPIFGSILVSLSTGRQQKMPVAETARLRPVLYRQAQLLFLHVMTQISASFYSKFTSSCRRDPGGESGGGKTCLALVQSLRSDAAGLISVVESVKLSLLHAESECAGGRKQQHVAAAGGVLQSLTTLGLVLVESFFGGGSVGGSVEDVFLNSQLVPLLVRTAFSPLPALESAAAAPEKQGEQQGEELLYAAMSCSSRRLLLSLLAGLALLSAEDGSRPFAAFLCQTAFPALCGAEARAFVQLVPGVEIAGGPEADEQEHVVVAPALLGCMFAAISAGVSVSPDVSRAASKRSGHALAPAAYSTLFSRLSGNVCYWITSLNRHCGNQSLTVRDGGEHELRATMSTCQCTKVFVRSQIQLNLLLAEVHYVLWAIQSTHCTRVAPLNTTARGALRSCVQDLSAAVAALQASPACPAAAQCALAQHREHDAQLKEEEEQKVQVKDERGGGGGGDISPSSPAENFNELISSNGGVGEQQERDQGRADIACWQGVLAARRRHVHGVQKMLKMLTSVLAGGGAAESKTD